VKLIGKKSTVRSRARPPSDLQRAPSGLAYRSRRTEQEQNVGRGSQRKLINRQSIGLNFWLQRFGLLILLVAITISLINGLSLSKQPKIMPLNAADNRFLRPSGVYEAAASRLLAGSVWNRNKLTVDTAKLNQQLLDRFPELASVHVTIPFLAHRPLIYLEVSRPALKLVTDNGSFIVSNTGKALIRDDTDDSYGSLNLPLLNDQSSLKIKPNQPALPTAQVGFIQTVTAQLNAKQFTIASMTLPPAASELDVQPEGQPYFIKFNLHGDNPRGQAGTFLATIAELKKRNVVPSRYVDVRVDGRAYYQ
jgi:hypothetical protein